MNMNLDDVRKEKIWEELLSTLRTEELDPDEKTIKIIMEERKITYCVAKKHLRDLEKAGLVTSRIGKNNAKIYKPVVPSHK